MSDTADDNPPPGGQPAGDKSLEAKPAPAVSAPGRRTRQFRDRLLERLPTLAAPNTQEPAMSVSEEMTAIGDLGADAFLEPLAQLARSRRE